MKKLWIILLLLVWPCVLMADMNTYIAGIEAPAGGGSISYVQSNAAAAGSVAFSGSVTAGNLIVVFVNSPGAPSTPTDNGSGSNTYSSCGTPIQSGAYFGAFYTVADTTESLTISVSGANSIEIHEYSGNHATPLDQYDSNTGTTSGTGTNNVDLGTVTPTESGSLVIVCGGATTHAFTAGTNVSWVTPDNGTFYGLVFYYIQATAAEITGYASLGYDSENYHGLIVSFKPE